MSWASRSRQNSEKKFRFSIKISSSSLCEVKQWCEAKRKTEPELGVQLHPKTTVTHPYDPAVVLFRLEREAAAIIIETVSST